MTVAKLKILHMAAFPGSAVHLVDELVEKLLAKCFENDTKK